MKLRSLLVTILYMLSIVTVYGASDTKIETSSVIKFANPLPASFSVNNLFDRMERVSENINTIVSEVELSDKVGTNTVFLKVKSPDKFAIVFEDGSSSVHFNGLDLFIYIKSLNECFYHCSESSFWMEKLSDLIAFFEPRKLFANMTRNTLDSFFDIEAIRREKIGEDYFYILKFTPKMKDIFTRIFELGYYEAVFSDKTYLPVKITEYSTENKPKNKLIVKGYKMNEPIDDDEFVYHNSTQAIMVPFSIVILQKIEEYKDKAVSELEKAKESFTNNLLNWGF